MSLQYEIRKKQVFQFFSKTAKIAQITAYSVFPTTNSIGSINHTVMKFWCAEGRTISEGAKKR
jgi:hypothetical protein